jgi:hypothetical protein
VVGLEARPPNIEGVGEVTVRTLVRQALRMRPDRLVVGEVRNPAAVSASGRGIPVETLGWLGRAGPGRTPPSTGRTLLKSEWDTRACLTLAQARPGPDLLCPRVFPGRVA